MGFWCLGGAWSGIGGDLWGAVASMGILHGIIMKLIKKKHKVTLIFPKISEVLPRTDCQAETVDQNLPCTTWEACSCMWRRCWWWGWASPNWARPKRRAGKSFMKL